MSNLGKVLAVNISEQKGTIKKPVPKIVLDKTGIVGDAHSGNWHRQISLLSKESIDKFSEEFSRKINYGEFAENLTLENIDLAKVAILDRFKIGEVELEVTQIGKVCHGDSCAIYREVGKCVMPKEGIFCRVINGGEIKANNVIEYIPHVFKICIITLSDRAFQGEYEDRTGPAAAKILNEFFANKRWHLELAPKLLADDADVIAGELEKTLIDGVDVIFTLGGTGVGPRDCAPEAVMEVCDKLIPGVMENIRVKYGAQKPNALLSRSVAGIQGMTQIYALPGSVNAATEYLGEVLQTLEHVVFMLHGIDAH